MQKHKDQGSNPQNAYKSQAWPHVPVAHRLGRQYQKIAGAGLLAGLAEKQQVLGSVRNTQWNRAVGESKASCVLL